jgi:hypothetical protein
VGKNVEGGWNLGLRNTNAWRFDEDRSVFSCTKVYKGGAKGEVIIGTNHGVTRIDGDTFNSHVHPVWFENGSQRAGYTYALGIAQDGDVLIGNDWMYGRLTPLEDLETWDENGSDDPTPFRVIDHLEMVNSLPEFDFWRGIAETTEVVTAPTGQPARYMYLGNIRPASAIRTGCTG